MLLFSGSVSSERSSSSAPCLLRTNSPLGFSPWFVSSNLVFKRRFLFYSFGFHYILPESALLFGPVKGESYFTHFKLAPRLRSLAHLLNSRVCVCGEQGVDKRLLNGGGKCSRGVRTPRSGWEWGVFVAKLWRWSCVTNSAMRKTYFKTRTNTTSADVRATASVHRSL